MNCCIIIIIIIIIIVQYVHILWCILAMNSNSQIHQLELKWRPLHDQVYSMAAWTLIGKEGQEDEEVLFWHNKSNGTYLQR